tara:strand:- start:3532 stop:4842 length:1311 start_codon:yes stop_codon:yes gene_type:complete
MSDAPPSDQMTAPSGTKRLLVVDDDLAVVQYVRSLGRHQMFAVDGAANLATAVDCARRNKPDAVLIDMHLGPEESGLDLPAMLRRIPGMEKTPMGFLSGNSSFASRIAAVRAGAVLYSIKPLEPDQLSLAVQHLLASGTAEAAHILIATHNRDEAVTYGQALSAAGFPVSYCHNGSLLPEALSAVRPDYLLLDDQLPPYCGLDTVRLIRSMIRWSDLYVALLTDSQSEQSRRVVCDSGADEWLYRPLTNGELCDRVSATVRRVRQLRERFDRDQVTGLSLRRPFLDMAGAQFEEARRRGQSLAIGMLDLDHFKRVNDTHGHHTGDRVLASLGRLLQTRLRPQDLKARWGGEEFCVAFEGESAQSAGAHIERLLVEFMGQRCVNEAGDRFEVSFSAGVAALPGDGNSVETLIQRADARLYEAKRGGRARVVSAQDAA